jgi:hypothetical protein
MKNLKITFLALNVLIAMPAIGMEQAPQAPAKSFERFEELPGDVKRIIIPLIASSNVAEVAEAIRSLNATNKFFHNFISTPEGIISILERMPDASSAIDLVKILEKTNLPAMQSSAIQKWLVDAYARDPFYNNAKLGILPIDVQNRFSFYLANKTPHAVARGIFEIAGDSPDYHNFINNPNNMLSILEGFRHKDDAIAVVESLRFNSFLPVFHHPMIEAWLADAKARIIRRKA